MRTNDLGVVRRLSESLATLLVGLPAVGILCRNDGAHISDAEYEVGLYRSTMSSQQCTGTEDSFMWRKC